MPIALQSALAARSHHDDASPGPAMNAPRPDLWPQIRADAARIASRERLLRPFMQDAVLDQPSFAAALASQLSRKLSQAPLMTPDLAHLVQEAFEDDPGIVDAAMADLVAIVTRDPAVDDAIVPFLYFKGFHALEWHRVGHWLWCHGRHDLAHFLQSRVSELFAIDIHPAVPVGSGVFIDHGTGLVVGETASIGNDVSILQGVTLGGTGKEHGNRHPKVRDGVLLAAGATVLGNIEIGARAKVGASSVVLKDVPPCATVVGVPAKIVGWCRETAPAYSMDQTMPEHSYDI